MVGVMAKDKAGWVYCVRGSVPTTCFPSWQPALKKAQAAMKRHPKDVVEVEKVWSEFAGHTNPWRKGAGTTFFYAPWDREARGDGKTVWQPQSGAQDPRRR